MENVKELVVRVIEAKPANVFIRKTHYSKKVACGSQLHFGVFWEKVLHGVLQFGSSINKKGMVNLVKGTGWNSFLELNRLAFDEYLPRNSESRAISICMKLIKKNAPHIKWVVSFADATQCGDGAIYRASGFILTDVRKNLALWELADKEVVCRNSLTAHGTRNVIHELTTRTCKDRKSFYEITGGSATTRGYMEKIGAKRLKGFQLRYLYFLDKSKIKDLTVPILPFSRIKELGASMYKGKSCADSVNSTLGFQPKSGGSSPTPALQTVEA